MSPLLSPNIQFIPNIFAVQYTRESSVCIRVLMVAAAGDQMNMSASPDLLQHMVIAKIWHIMDRAVEINIIIEISFCIFRQIINTAHGNATINDVRSFKK